MAEAVGNISFRADMSDIRRQLATLPGLTAGEAQRMVIALERQMRRAENAAREVSRNSARAAADAARAIDGLRSTAASFIPGAAEAAEAAELFSTAMGGMGASASALAGPVGAGAAAAVGFGLAAYSAATSTAELAKEINAASIQYGASRELLVGLRSAALATGSDFDKVRDALEGFVDKLGEAALNGGDSEEAFKRLGVSVRDAKGQIRDVDSAFLATADALARLESGADRAKMASELLGDSGAKALPIFAQGSEAIKAYTASAKAAGIVISDDLVKSSRDLDQAWARLGQAAESLQVQLGGALLPALVNIVEGAALFSKAIIGIANDLAPVIKAVSLLSPVVLGLKLQQAALALVTGEAADAAIKQDQALRLVEGGATATGKALEKLASVVKTGDGWLKEYQDQVAGVSDAERKIRDEIAAHEAALAALQKSQKDGAAVNAADLQQKINDVARTKALGEALIRKTRADEAAKEATKAKAEADRKASQASAEREKRAREAAQALREQAEAERETARAADELRAALATEASDTLTAEGEVLAALAQRTQAYRQLGQTAQDAGAAEQAIAAATSRAQRDLIALVEERGKAERQAAAEGREAQRQAIEERLSLERGLSEQLDGLNRENTAQRRQSALEEARAVYEDKTAAATAAAETIQQLAEFEVAARGQTLARLQAQREAALKAGNAAEAAALATRIAEERKAGRAAFRAGQAAAVAQIAIAAPVAIMQALAQLGPVAGAIAAVGIGAAAATQAAAVLAQKSPYHSGGEVRGPAPDEVDIRAQAGERVIRRGPSQRYAEQLDELNRTGELPGGGGGPASTVVVLDGRVAARLVDAGWRGSQAGARARQAAKPGMSPAYSVGG